MIKLERLNEQDVNNELGYLDQLIDLYGVNLKGKFYKYRFKDNERWLYNDDGYCTILGRDGEYIVYTSFYIDGLYRLAFMEFDEFQAGVDDDETFLWQEGTDICDSIRLVNRTEMANNDGYTGLIVHHQKNSATGRQLIVAYQNQYREDGYIYPYFLKRPFVISFIEGNKSTQYINHRTTRDFLSYDIITIKEFGLMEFLKYGSYALQREYEIHRYFKILGQKEDGTCITSIPLSYGYTQEEMENMVKEKGFRLEIPQFVLDYFNGVYEESEEYKELAEAIKEYDLEHKDEKRLVKDSDNNGNSTL